MLKKVWYSDRCNWSELPKMTFKYNVYSYNETEGLWTFRDRKWPECQQCTYDQLNKKYVTLILLIWVTTVQLQPCCLSHSCPVNYLAVNEWWYSMTCLVLTDWLWSLIIMYIHLLCRWEAFQLWNLSEILCSSIGPRQA